MNPLEHREFDVAIVGGGFSGSMVAVHLAKIAPYLRVLLVDKDASFGRGVAYSTDSAFHILNVPAARMSAFADQPNHFWKWLERRAPKLQARGLGPISPSSFLPRQLFGEYVGELVAEASRASPWLATVKGEIVDIEPQDDQLILTEASGTTYSAARVVLALGNFAPGDPPTRDHRFHRSPRYLNEPWSPKALARSIAAGDILILGAGLTALDLLLTFNAQDVQGKIHVVSRHGLFPQPHRPDEAHPHPGLLSNVALPSNLKGMVRLVRRTVDIAANRGLDWRAVMEALRPHTQTLWKSLTIPERRRFMRHLRPFWECHRHRAPPAMLAVKDEMIRRGQVVAHKARVRAITEVEDVLLVTLLDRMNRTEFQLKVQLVANCTGPECNYYKLKDPLVINLLARGLIHPDQLFIGLMTAPNGAVLNYLGQPSPNIYTLGSPMRGMLFETTAVSELRVQAKLLAEELARSGFARPSVPKERERGPQDPGKIMLISNRGPNDFVWQGETWVPRPAAGGLVSMIDSLARQSDVTWFCCVSEPAGAADARGTLFTSAADQTDPEHHLVPVPLPARIYQAYYGAISNEVLWMLQHHLVGQFGYSELNAARHEAWNGGYLEANRRMVIAIRASGIRPRAFLIQDYHFYPLPAMLRQVFPETPILHFTHIPFPDAATLKLIPQNWRNSILNGLLGADIIGMQTLWDVRPFLACCEELLHLEVDYRTGTVRSEDGRSVQVKVFPASVHPGLLLDTMKSAPVAQARDRLAPCLQGLSVIRVDRLDPSKNQIIGFKAFGRLLEMRPDLRGKVRFLAFLVPSRTDLNVYREYREAVYEMIADVNRRFADESGFEPITVFYTNDREQALAAMEQCDVLLVNSREDGMNLVVKEWAIVSKRPGVCVISETAGVASELGTNALLVSPLDLEGTAQAMATALDMAESERRFRLDQIRTAVESWTAEHWLAAQLEALGVKRRA